MSSILELEGVTLRYGKILAVRDVSLAVPEGTIVALLGPNGAGKTTTVGGVAGMVSCTSGTISFMGERINGRAPHRMVRMGLAYVPQGRELFPGLSVLDNLRLGAFAVGRRVNLDRRLDDLYGYFPRLRDRARQQAGSLSGGEQQMLAIARALISEPRLLMLDEPSAGLAPQVMRQVFDIVAQIAQEERTTVLLAEQNAHQVMRIMDYAYVMDSGAVVVEGTRDQLERDDTVRATYLGETGVKEAP